MDLLIQTKAIKGIQMQFLQRKVCSIHLNEKYKIVVQTLFWTIFLKWKLKEVAAR